MPNIKLTIRMNKQDYQHLLKCNVMNDEKCIKCWEACITAMRPITLKRLENAVLRHAAGKKS